MVHRFTLIALVVCSLFFSACGSYPRIQIPTIQKSVHVDIQPNDKLEPIAFTKAIVSMNAGQVIGSWYSGSNQEGEGYCSPVGGGPITLSSGDMLFSDGMDEYAKAFYRVMTARGYNVVGDPNDMFGDDDASSAVYLVGAKITDIKANICRLYDILWSGAYMGVDTGELFLKVEWAVYSTFERKTVATATTYGYARDSSERPEVLLPLFGQAFADAVDALANDQGFYNMLQADTPSSSGPSAAASNESPIAIPKISESRSPVADNPDRLTRSVVTILSGGGHGTGFFITKDGYLLTNAHVVGGAEKVKILTDDHREYTGWVIRKNKLRDVALVKVDISEVSPVSIRQAEAKVAENVYAVGTPQELALSSTVSRGIISAIRMDEKKQPYIQSDVDIHGGNSGGPLMDSKGNVLGITVMGMYMGEGKTSSGLNLFVPIHDALRVLNITIN